MFLVQSGEVYFISIYWKIEQNQGSLKIAVYLSKTICAELQENYWQKWIGCFEHVQILKIFIVTIYEI